MRRPRRPLFVARRSYQMRRMRDAARLMPFVGGFLFSLLLLWEPASGPRDLARDAIYLFLVWAGLILFTAFLARRLSGDPAADDPAGSGDDA